MQTKKTVPKNLVPKAKVSNCLKYLGKNLFLFAEKYNFYVDFGGYMDSRSCLSYLIFKKMLNKALDKYPEDIKDSEEWEEIKEKTKQKILKKYFIEGESGRIEDIIDWLKPKYTLFRKYKTLKVKTMVYSQREERKGKRDLIRRYMFVYKDCLTAGKELVEHLRLKRQFIMNKGKKDYFVNQNIYHFPKRLKLLNRDLWLQPTSIKAMDKIMEYETPQTHFIKYDYANRGKKKFKEGVPEQEELTPEQIRQIMQEI